MMYLLIGTDIIIGKYKEKGLYTQRLYIKNIFYYIYTHTTLSIHIQHVHVPQDMFHLVFIYYLLPIFN